MKEIPILPETPRPPFRIRQFYSHALDLKDGETVYYVNRIHIFDAEQREMAQLDFRTDYPGSPLKAAPTEQVWKQYARLCGCSLEMYQMLVRVAKELQSAPLQGSRLRALSVDVEKVILHALSYPIETAVDNSDL